MVGTVLNKRKGALHRQRGFSAARVAAEYAATYLIKEPMYNSILTAMTIVHFSCWLDYRQRGG